MQLRGGAVCLDAGVGEEEGEIREGRQRHDILTFIDRITDENIMSVIPLTILLVKGSRHCTEISV